MSWKRVRELAERDGRDPQALQLLPLQEVMEAARDAGVVE